MLKKRKGLKKVASPRIHASAKGYRPLPGSSGGLAGAMPPAALPGATKFASKGLGGHRDEGLPHGSLGWDDGKRAKRGRATGTEEQQGAKERRREAKPQREAKSGRALKKSEEQQSAKKK